VDVKNGEEEHCGKSWVVSVDVYQTVLPSVFDIRSYLLQNKEQARVVVALAKKLQVLGCSGWRIITPYDAQRSLIENNLKAEGVVWEDKVFNVDSFQGGCRRSFGDLFLLSTANYILRQRGRLYHYFHCPHRSNWVPTGAAPSQCDVDTL
jgi:hypothetical protein